MIPLPKETKLIVKEYFSIFCRHKGMIAILTLAFGIFAAYFERNIFPITVAGFTLGLAASYLLEYLDCTLKTPEDVERCAKMPFLGYIPSIEKNPKDRKDVDLISYRKYYSCAAEAFRKTEAALLSSFSQEEPIKTLVVSSFIPKEGKSFVAANLAITLAASQGPALLIDGDLRKGRLSEIFDAGSDKGLTNALAGASSWQEAVVSTDIPNLSLLPLGAPSPNPGELLNTGRLREILREAEKEFKIVVIDSPPVLSVTDALILGRECNGLVFAVKAGVTPIRHVVDAQRMIEGKVKVLGVVLNGVDVRGTHYRRFRLL